MENLNGDYITTVEAATLYKKSESMIARLCQLGRLPGVKKVGKTWLIPRTSIESYTPGKRGRRAKKETLAAELDSIRAEVSAAKEK